MRGKSDDHFLQSLVLALAVLALLLLLLSRLIAPTAVVGPKVDLVEVQLAGPGGSGGKAGSGLGSSSGPASAVPRRPQVRAVPPAPTRQPAPTPVESAAPLPQASGPAAVEPEAPSPPASEAAPGPAGSGTEGAGTGTAGGGGSGTGSGPGSGEGGVGSGSGDSAGGLPPASIADIDPFPLGTISAGYPPSARRLGQQGLVKIQADINTDGVVISCLIVVSSGFASLDNAAVDAVRSARFQPAMKNGKPVEALLIVPIRFRLTRE